VVSGVVYVGSDDRNVYALNATNGDKIWAYATLGYVGSSPAVVNGVVYIGSGDWNVYALKSNIPSPTPSPTAQLSLSQSAIYGVGATVAIVAVVAAVFMLRKPGKMQKTE
jgi:outer membrane protein assembly factor BamB